jgi:hypothetical protein
MRPMTSMSTRRLAARRTFMQAAAVLVATLVAAPPADARGGRGGGSASRGSVRSANRSGSGGSWSNANSRGTTSRTTSGDTSTRTTTAQGRGGQTATGTRNVSKDGDTVTVDRNVQSSTGASKSSQKQIEMDDGRVESVERDTTVTNRQGQTASWEGKAEREGYGWEFEGEGKNRYGQSVEAKGYAARGPYGSGVVADVEGGRYGDRTVAAGRAYGGRAYAGTLPAGYRGYSYYGRPYYGYGGSYYRPYGSFYYPVPPPWGYCCYHDSDLVGAVALTVVGMSLLYSDGVYYEKSQVSGETQYKVVAPPLGATLPHSGVPADAATVTVAGTPYYYYGNVFYKVVPQGGTMSFVTVTKPAGVTTVAALPADVKPQEAGNLTYLVSGGKYYMPYLDPAGAESYIVVDKPKATAAAGAAPGTQTKTIPLSVPAGTTLMVRLGSDISSTGKVGDRFQGNLAGDLLAGGQLVATKGTPVYGRVAQATAGTGTGGAPSLAIELTDIEVAGRVVRVQTTQASATGEAKKAGKKVLGGAALGAGIGAAIDGGEGAAWGAGVGAVVGIAAAKKSPGNQVTFAAGSSIEFRTAQPLTIQKHVAVASGGD